MKWLAALLLPLALLTLAVACEEEEQEAATATPSPAATATATPQVTASPEATPTSEATPTEEAIAFHVVIGEAEVLALQMSSRYLMYATKEEYNVSVWKRDVVTGQQELLFAYREERPAEHVGNYWRELPASVSLSPDGSTLAYIDDTGLWVRNLATGETEVLIEPTETAGEAPDEGSWPIGDFCCARGLAAPSWSGDGSALSVEVAFYEGGGTAIVDPADGSACMVHSPGVSARVDNNPVWGPSEQWLVLPSGGEFSASGLFVAQPDDLCSAVDVSAGFREEPFWWSSDAAWSPDGSLLAFSYTYPGREVATETLALVTADGSGFTVVDEDGFSTGPIFPRDGSLLYYFRFRQAPSAWSSGEVESGPNAELWVYDIATQQREKAVSLSGQSNFYEPLFWTSEEYLALLGYQVGPGCVYKSCGSRLVILDLSLGRVVYASPIVDFGAFMGLVD